jgi:hypothetical protein
MALIASGLGLRKLTASQATRNHLTSVPTQSPVTEMIVPFELLLSAAASEIKVDTGRTSRTLEATHSPVIGRFVFDPTNPHLALTVHWKLPATPDEHRFAKLTLEIPGQETFYHVFDAASDIDDVIEIPMPSHHE